MKYFKAKKKWVGGELLKEMKAEGRRGEQEDKKNDKSDKLYIYIYIYNKRKSRQTDRQIERERRRAIYWDEY